MFFKQQISSILEWLLSDNVTLKTELITAKKFSFTTTGKTINFFKYIKVENCKLY